MHCSFAFAVETEESEKRCPLRKQDGGVLLGQNKC